MKNYLILLFVMLAASQAYGFKDKKDKKDPKDAKIDSLSKQCDTLHIKLDSLSKEFTRYYDSYSVIKEKVVKYEFAPERTSLILDSLIAARDSKFSSAYAIFRDSLNAVKQENMQLKTALNGITSDEAAKNRLVNELKQLKELLDSKILNQAEFDAKKANLLHKWQ